MYLSLVRVQEDGEVEWNQKGVCLVKPSVGQCKEVISQLEDKHEVLILLDSSSESVQFLIPAVLKGGTITKLGISSSFLITRDDILSFSSQLSTNKSLTTLILCEGSIGDGGVIALAQSLQCNEALKNLYLNDNTGITSASAQSLADLLLTNKLLKHLYLHRTNIDTDGVLVLMESLRTNNTLKILYLDKQYEEVCFYYEHTVNIVYC